MARVLYSGRARSDLERIWEWIFDASGEAAADRILGRIEGRIATLSRHPRMGPERPDIAANARSLRAERWIALYQIVGDEVRVVAVADGAMDLPGLGRERGLTP